MGYSINLLLLLVRDKTVCGVVRVDGYTAATRWRGRQAELVRGGHRIHHVLMHVEHGNLLLLPLNALLSCELLLLHYFLVFPQLQYLKLKGFPCTYHSVCDVVYLFFQNEVVSRSQILLDHAVIILNECK